MGPTVAIPDSPLGVFNLFFTDAICGFVVEQTNLYAQQVLGEKYEQWEKVTVEELRAYFGFMILSWVWCHCLPLMTTGDVISFSTTAPLQIESQGTVSERSVVTCTLPGMSCVATGDPGISWESRDTRDPPKLSPHTYP